MQALGNDFIMIDAVSQTFSPVAHTLRCLADRHQGIGCDQLLIAQPAVSAGTDVFCQIFNADGSEAEQCGNGLRCFARFIQAQGLVSKTQGLLIETKAGVFHADILADGSVKVDMGRPVFTPEDIPFIADEQRLKYSLTSVDSNNETFEMTLGVASMGNPHAVTRVDCVDEAPVERYGACLESHAHFPQRVNVEFMQIDSPQAIKLRIYERGAGETNACGSGACAAVAVGQAWGDLSNRVQVSMKGGVLHIERDPATEHLLMTGAAHFVFTGKVELPNV